MGGSEARSDGGFLLVDADWFPWARDLANRDAVFGAMAGELRRRCDELLDPSSDKHLEPERLDSVWWKTRMGAKQLVVATWDLAMSAHLHQDERHRSLALRVFRTLVEHNMAENSGGTCYGMPYRTWFAQPLDSGHAAEALGAAFDLLRPFMDDGEILKTADYLARFIQILHKFQRVQNDDGCANLQNIPMIGRFGMGVLAAALERAGGEPAEADLEVCRRACLRYLDGGGHEEGVLPEGPMYGFACMKHIAVAGTVLLRLGDDSVWRSDAWDQVVAAYASQVVPCDGELNPMNDCYPVRLTSWLLEAAKRRRNNLARWLWESMVQPLGEGRWDAPVPWNHIHAPWWNGLLPHALASYDPDVPPASPEQCGVAKKRYFPVRGVLDQRTGWAADDWFLTVSCCPDVRWRSRAGSQHSQADRGHFSFFALGERFLIDPGYGNETMSNSTAVLRFGATGEAHSVPEIGGAMQRKTVRAAGFSDVRLDGWATFAKMDFHECYPSCSLARRVVAVVPGLDGAPLYVAIHDRMETATNEKATYGLFCQADADTEARLEDRETVDLVGGRTGALCRVIATTHSPGRFLVDEFLGHPRLRFQCQTTALHALTLLIPWRHDEPPPTFERSAADNDAGFSAKLRFRGVEDSLFLNSGIAPSQRYAGITDVSPGPGNLLALGGIETDAPFGIFRQGAERNILVVEGTRLVLDGETAFAAKRREDYVGPAS